MLLWLPQLLRSLPPWHRRVARVLPRRNGEAVNLLRRYGAPAHTAALDVASVPT